MTQKQVFITLTLGVKGIKPFSSTLMLQTNKLNCSPGKRFKDLSNIFFLAISDEEKALINLHSVSMIKDFFFVTYGRNK